MPSKEQFLQLQKKIKFELRGKNIKKFAVISSTTNLRKTPNSILFLYNIRNVVNINIKMSNNFISALFDTSRTQLRIGNIFISASFIFLILQKL